MRKNFEREIPVPKSEPDNDSAESISRAAHELLKSKARVEADRDIEDSTMEVGWNKDEEPGLDNGESYYAD